MKKAILALLITAVMAVPCLAFDGSMGSGQLSESSQVVAGNVYLTAMTVLTNGTNDATVILYDSTAASGKVLAKVWLPGGLYADRVTWTYPVRALNGIYASVSGTGASVLVEYIKR